MTPSRSVIAGAVALALTLALTACGPSAAPEETDVAAHVAELPDSVSPEGVLKAAVLLSTADIEAAVSEGLVTPDEVDAAKRAIETGTLDLWRQRAEEETP